MQSYGRDVIEAGLRSVRVTQRLPTSFQWCLARCRSARAASTHSPDWTLGLKAWRPLLPEVKKVNPVPASAVWKSNKGACSVSTQRSEGGLDG